MSRFHTIEDARGQEFYQLPKDLIKNEMYKDLSANSKIAYAVLKDRHSVSLKNGWVDEKGVYFLLSDNELAEILDTSIRSASRYKNDLQKFELIHMERQGLNRRNKIYLLKPESAVVYKKDSEPFGIKDRTKLSSPDTTKLSSPDTTILSSQDRTILSTYSNNNLSNNNLSKLEEEEAPTSISHFHSLKTLFNETITASNLLIDNKINEWLELLPFEVIKAEIENSSLNGAKSWAYVQKALEQDYKMGIKDLTSLQNKIDTFTNSKNSFKGKKKPIRVEYTPEWLKEQDGAKESKLEVSVGGGVELEDSKSRKEDLLKQLQLMNKQTEENKKEGIV